MVLITRKDSIATQDVFDGAIFSVHLDTVRTETGFEMTREVVHHNGGVVIACKPTPDEVLLIKQYRYSVDEELIELPAGRVNKDEDRLAAAKRELIEETGFKAESWTALPPMYSAPGFCDELLTCYLATDISWVGKNLDVDEETDVMRVSLKEAWQLVLNGKIKDAKTFALLGIVCHS